MGQPLCKIPLLDVGSSIHFSSPEFKILMFTPKNFLSKAWLVPIPVFSASKAASQHPTSSNDFPAQTSLPFSLFLY